MKRHLTHKCSTSPQVTLDTFEKQTFLHKLNPKQIDIIHHLQSGYYPALVARRLNVSRSYVSRLVNKLLRFGLITQGYKDPLQNRATVYDVSKELLTYISRFDNSEENELTLCTPHNVRYKRHIISQSAPIATNLTRFAHAKFKFIKSYAPRGGKRYVFEMKGTHGRIRMIVHPSSIEALIVDRNYVPAKSVDEATNILSMSLQSAYEKFTDEQRWCNCRIELAEPVIVGSVHYAFKSKILKDEIIRKGQSHLKITPTMEVDNSPVEHADIIHAEAETKDKNEADRFDVALRMLPRAPGLLREELKPIADSITNINNRIDALNFQRNNVEAVCQSGLPIGVQFSMLQTVVAKQSESIRLMQETILGVVQNMSRILDRMDSQQNASSTQQQSNK